MEKMMSTERLKGCVPFKTKGSAEKARVKTRLLGLGDSGK